jgi:hypothetical protein
MLPQLIRNLIYSGQQWQAVFAFALVGNIFLLWIIVMAGQVFYDDAA